MDTTLLSHMNESTITLSSVDDFTPSAIHTDAARGTVARLVSLAIEGLPQMLDRHRNLFCYKRKKSPSGLVQEGLSRRYTMMTLLGLHRLQQSGKASPIDCDSVLSTLLSDLAWVDN